jgi:chemotaxis protein methyltransferase CheR
MVNSYEFVRDLVLKDAGIVLEAGKEYLVDSRLTPLVRTAGLDSIDALVKSVRTGRAPHLRREIVDAMTINETTFFRDVRPFELLRTTLLPQLIRARRSVRRLKIWYAASSTGQEPYSVSMLIDEAFPELATWDIEHLATDISRKALDRAAAGQYSQLEVNRGLPARLLVRYFEKRGLGYTLHERIRRTVKFRELNLNDDWPWLPTFDLVFLRNVMIYFDVGAKRRILGKVHNLLRADGALFLGGAETTINLDDRFLRVPVAGTGCYQPVSPNSSQK